MFYQFLRILSSGIFQKIPADRNSWLNLVPVDAVARAMYLIDKNKKKKNLTYNLVNSKYIRLGFGVNIASEFFGFRKPELLPLGRYRCKLLGFQKRLIEPYIPYCNYKAIFDSTNSNESLKNDSFLWPRPDRRLLAVLFRHCAKINYIKVKK